MSCLSPATVIAQLNCSCTCVCLHVCQLHASFGDLSLPVRLRQQLDLNDNRTNHCDSDSKPLLVLCG
jgi:hypothetical protein